MFIPRQEDVTETSSPEERRRGAEQKRGGEGEEVWRRGSEEVRRRGEERRCERRASALVPVVFPVILR